MSDDAQRADAGSAADRSDGLESPTDRAVEPDPSTDRELDWLALDAGEELRWVGGPRIQTVYPWAALGIVGAIAILGAIAADVLSPWAALCIPPIAVSVWWLTLRVSRTTYLITNRRIAAKTGVLGLSVRFLGLDRIQNTTFEQGVTGRLFDYGSVEIDPAGGAALSFRNVDDPARVRARLEAQRGRDSPTAVPGSREQWAAVLDEVRGWRRALERSR
ncbi:PH domain-containing protein [Halosolutus gelatinilyticus]|uniref:PH domain-containing protein n=1 Tax=Halosolutus gelatinilyticus TaxID=2931975 RepID=UPI001FF118FC|nr:PH domain-containing protein [Halosolutus gelatinilyticus]